MPVRTLTHHGVSSIRRDWVVNGNPQIEDGYTRIANELCEAFSRTKSINASQFRICFFIMRNTYGYQQKVVKTTYSNVANATSMSRRNVIRELKTLSERELVSISSLAGGISLSINKHYRQWQGVTNPSLVSNSSPSVKSVTSPSVKSVTDIGNKEKEKKEDIVQSPSLKFDEFWQVWPRKQGKQDALKSWKRHKLAKHADEIISHVKTRVATDRQWRNPKYIPLPATFLNGQRWTDEILQDDPNGTHQQPLTGNAAAYATADEWVRDQLAGTEAGRTIDGEARRVHAAPVAKVR